MKILENKLVNINRIVLDSEINPRRIVGDLYQIIVTYKTRIEDGKEPNDESLELIEIKRSDFDYLCVDGKRRILAGKELGLKKLRADILNAKYSKGRVDLIKYNPILNASNATKINHSWYEDGIQYKRLYDAALTQWQIAKSVGTSQSNISEHLNVYRALKDVSPAIFLDYSVAREIVRNGNPSDYQRIVDVVLENGL
jgi:hypothetical protein